MSQSLPWPWNRTTKATPCPLCRRSDCLVSSPSAPAAAICPRTASTVQIGVAGFLQIGVAGWLHELRTDGPTWAPWRRSLARINGACR